MLRQIKKKKQARQIVFFIFLFISIVFSTVSYKFELFLFKTIVSEITSFILYPFDILRRKAVSAIDFINHHIDVNKKYEELKFLVKATEYYKQQRDMLYRENQSLRKFFKVIPLFPKHTRIVTRILALPHIRQNLNMLIKNQEGIENDNCVVSEDALVGRISSVGYFECSVMLTTDIKSRIPAQIERNSHHIIVVGNNTQNLSIIASQGESFVKGDLIVTSGVGGIYPIKIPIAKIIGFSSDGSPIAKPIVNPFCLDYVMVVKEENNK